MLSEHRRYRFMKFLDYIKFIRVPRIRGQLTALLLQRAVRGPAYSFNL